MFAPLSTESMSSVRIAAAVRAYAEARAELGARTDLVLTSDAVRVGSHVWSALAEAGAAEAASSPIRPIAIEARLAADVDAVAADVAALVIRAPHPLLVRNWMSALRSGVDSLPPAARLALLTHAERVADALGTADAAADVCNLYVDAIVSSAYGAVPPMREGIAQLRRFAGASDARRALYASALSSVAGASDLWWRKDPYAREVMREIRKELKALAAGGSDPTIELALARVGKKASGGTARVRAADLAVRESDPVARELETALSEAGFPAPPGLVSPEALLVRAPWLPLERRGWLVCFDGETGFAPHREHGALLLQIAAKLDRPVEIVEDEFIDGRGWRLVFTAPERYALDSPAKEPDDWVDLGLLYQAVRIVAGDIPVWSLRTDDQTVALLCPPADASKMLARSGWLKHRGLGAKRVVSRRRVSTSS